MDRSKIQLGWTLGTDYHPDIKKGLFGIDESVAEMNRYIRKYDPSLRLKLVRQRDKPKRGRRR